MAARDRKDVRKALKKKGFTKEEGGKHEVYTLEVDGLLTSAGTVISRGSQYKTLGSPLISQMASELHLSNSQFLDLVDCPMKGEDYLAVLRDKQLLE